MQQGSEVRTTTAKVGGMTSTYPTDDEILGLDAEGTAPVTPDAGTATRLGAGLSRPDGGLKPDAAQDATQALTRSQAEYDIAEAAQQGVGAPEWLKPLLEDAKVGSEAQALWAQHQAYREIFPTVAEARGIKELFPGGVAEAKALLFEANELAAIDRAYFSAEAAAQAQLASYLQRENPRAFAAMVREAAQVLAERDPAAYNTLLTANAEQSDRNLRQGTASAVPSAARADGALVPEEMTREPQGELLRQRAEFDRERQEFRASVFGAFQQAANDAVVAQVRQAIEQTLAGFLPASVADNARSRVARDIFDEINATLQADSGLAQQVADILQQRRFDEPTRQQLVSLVFGRAKSLLPGVAKRIVSDWTGGMVTASREKAARQDAAAQRVDIAGGAIENVGKRSLRPRDIDYRKLTDDQILSLE